MVVVVNCLDCFATIEAGVDLGSAVGKDCTYFELQQDNRLKTSRDSNSSVDLIYTLHHSDFQNGVQGIQRHRHLTPETGQDRYRTSLQNSQEIPQITNTTTTTTRSYANLKK